MKKSFIIFAGRLFGICKDTTIDLDEPTPPLDPERRSGIAAWLGDRAAEVALWVYVGVAMPIIVFGLGRYHWFSPDEWAFLAGRDGTSLDDLFRPYNEHWTTVGVIFFRALYSVFALRTYIPYQLVAVAMHLCLVLLLRTIMQRAGVQGWLATAAAASFVLFGPGSMNIVSAFQIAFTGAVTFGLAQILLSDHEGPFDRRDVAGVAAGAVALMCSGIALPMVVACGAITLVRRGVVVAAAHTAPLAVIYGGWWLVYRPQTSVGFFGRPPLDRLLEWIINGEVGAFAELGHYRPVAIALGAVTVAGVVLAVSNWKPAAPRERLVVPVALFLAGVLVLGLVAQGRWWHGPDGGQINRYVYITVALSLPLIAVAADELARRWKVFLPAAIGLLLVAVPDNASDFERKPFTAAYHERQERLIRALPTLPISAEVPPDIAPFGITSPFLTVGFLVDANRRGELLEPDTPLTRLETDELTIRLGMSSGPWTDPTGSCDDVGDGLDLEPDAGDRFVITSPVRVSITREEGPVARVTFNANIFGPQVLTVQLDGLALHIEPQTGADAQLCAPG